MYESSDGRGLWAGGVMGGRETQRENGTMGGREGEEAQGRAKRGRYETGDRRQEEEEGN